MGGDGRCDKCGRSDPRDIYDDIAGVPEIIDALGVSPFRVRRWIDRKATVRCPAPVRQLRSGALYSLGEWQGWFSMWMRTRAWTPPAAIKKP